MKVIKAESIEKLLEQLKKEIDETIAKRDQCRADKLEGWEREDKRLLGHAAARLRVRDQLRGVLETAVSHWDIMDFVKASRLVSEALFVLAGDGPEEEELVVEPPDPETEERDSDLCARCGDPMDHDNHHLYCAGRSAYKLD